MNLKVFVLMLALVLSSASSTVAAEPATVDIDKVEKYLVNLGYDHRVSETVDGGKDLYITLKNLALGYSGSFELRIVSNANKSHLFVIAKIAYCRPEQMTDGKVLVELLEFNRKMGTSRYQLHKNDKGIRQLQLINSLEAISVDQKSVHQLIIAMQNDLVTSKDAWISFVTMVKPKN